MDWVSHLQERLASCRDQDAFRIRWIVETGGGTKNITIEGRSYRNFGSNDYLGLSAHPDLIDAAAEAVRSGLGSGGSPLVTGYRSSHAAFEREAADFAGFPKALLFGSGYQANLALLSALLSPGDVVYVDRLAHASINDGIRLCGARLKRFRHNDIDHLERIIDRSGAKRSVIVTEALFSMDGDRAPITDLLRLAEEADALLIVDEAHSFGLYGPQGRGLLVASGLSSDRLILVAPLGKAMGMAGAFVATTETIVETLIQFARPYIYSTAMATPMAETLRIALGLIETADEPRARLQRHIAIFRARQADSLWPTADKTSPIQPYFVGDAAKSLLVAKSLAEAGCWIPAIRYPTVPKAQARLRISLTAAHDEADIACLCDALEALSPFEQPKDER